MSAVSTFDTFSNQHSCVYPLYVLPHQQLCFSFMHVVRCKGYSLRGQTHEKEKTDQHNPSLTHVNLPLRLS